MKVESDRADKAYIYAVIYELAKKKEKGKKGGGGREKKEFDELKAKTILSFHGALQ